MKTWRVILVLTIGMFAFAGNTNAAIADLPDANGIGYFKDLSTGYTWMDVDNFLGMTYAEIESSLSGTDFQIASNDEMQGLLASAPLAFSYSYTAEHIATFNEYYSIMGGSGWGGDPNNPTNTDWFRIIWGMYEDLSPTIQWSYYTTGPGIYNPSNMGWAGSSGYTESYALGAFVVDSTPVPVPAALYLLGSGIVGLVVSRRAGPRRPGR